MKAVDINTYTDEIIEDGKKTVIIDYASLAREVINTCKLVATEGEDFVRRHTEFGWKRETGTRHRAVQELVGVVLVAGNQRAPAAVIATATMHVFGHAAAGRRTHAGVLGCRRRRVRVPERRV